MKKKYVTLDGKNHTLENLSLDDSAFLDRLSTAASAKDADYFELLKQIKGPGAFLLKNGTMTREVAESLAYIVAHDIVDRVGIRDGWLLEPGTTVPAQLPSNPLSLTEAAEIIGISRSSVHQALKEGRLKGTQVGNAWVIARRDAQEYLRLKVAPASGSAVVRGFASPTVVPMAAKAHTK